MNFRDVVFRHLRNFVGVAEKRNFFSSRWMLPSSVNSMPDPIFGPNGIGPSAYESRAPFVAAEACPAELLSQPERIRPGLHE